MANQTNRCYFEGHLNSPIISDEVNFILSNTEFYCNRHKNVKRYINENFVNIQSFENSDKCPWMTAESVIIGLKPDERSNKWGGHNFLTGAMEAALWNLRIHHEAYFGHNILNEEFNDKLRTLLHDTNIIKNFNNKERVEYIKQTITNSEQSLGTFYKISDEIYMEKELTIIKDSLGQNWLYPTTFFMCCLDNLQTRFYIYLHVCIKEADEGLPGLSQYYLKLNKFVLYLRSKYKNLFFGIMKNWDSLVIGKSVSDPVNDMGFNSLLSGVTEELSSLGVDNNDITEFKNYATCHYYTEDQDIQIRCAFYFANLCKNYGHPILSPTDGIAKLRVNSKKETVVDDCLARRTLCMFRRTYILGYFKSRGKYPNLIISPFSNRTLITCINESRLPSSNELNLIPLDEWGNITLLKNHDLSLELDERELLKDTACSPPREEWFLPYDQCAFKILYNQTKPRGSGTYEPRVLARYLKGDEGELIQKIANQSALHYNHNRDDIVQLCRKERELNIDGRVFCKQTYEMRLFQVCLEKSLSDNILPFIKEQTMTNTELEVTKRMDKVASTISKQGQYNINLDITKWNQLQRHDLNKYISSELDSLHGKTNLYSDSHFWFNRCMVLLGSRLTPPQIGPNLEPLEGEFCHYNQLGGFEGMRQKAWTITTIMIIKIALEECNMKGETMGQGDNQVIHIMLTKEQQTNPLRYIILLLNTLDNLFERGGLKLKLQETWYSRNLFEYSKVRFYKGIRVDDSLKRLNRLIPDINEGFPSTHSLLTSTSTCTENISRNYSSPSIPFFINSLETCNIWRRKGLTVNKSVRYLKALLNFPSIFGGFPISNIFQHSQRGFSDPLTIWLKIWQVIIKYSPEVMGNLSHIVPFNLKNEMDCVRLVEDMYSLNITGLPNFEREAREIIEEFLPSYVTNPNVTKLIGVSREDLTNLCRTLVTMRPYIANLAHEILRNSNEGIQLQLIGSFANIQTINRLINTDEERETNIFSLGKVKDQEAIDITKKRIMLSDYPCRSDHIVIEHLKKYKCTFLIANLLRELTWGFPVEGITSPVPSEQVMLINYDHLPKTLRADCIIAKTSHDLRNEGKKALLTRGPYPPYLGSSTPEKMTKPKLTVISPNPTTKAISKLFYLKSYIERMDVSSNIVTLLDSMIKNKLSTLPTEFQTIPLEDWCGKNFGGSYEHRFKASSQKRSALYSLNTNIATHVNINTNQLGKALRGNEDYNLFFQEIFLFIQNSIIERCHSEMEICDTYAIPLNCYNCTYLIRNRPIQLSSHPNYVPQNYPPHGMPHLLDRERYKNILDSVAALSLSIGRRIATSDKTSFEDNSATESIGLDKTDDITERLGSNFMSEFRSCDINYIIVGILQNSYQFEQYITGKSCHYPTDILTHLSYLIINCNRIEELVSLLRVRVEKHSTITQVTGFQHVLAPALRLYILKHKDKFWLTCGLTGFIDDSLQKQSYLWRHFFVEIIETSTISRVQKVGIKSIPMFVEGGLVKWVKQIPKSYTKGFFKLMNIYEKDAISFWREIKSELNEYTSPTLILTLRIISEEVETRSPISMKCMHLEYSPYEFNRNNLLKLGTSKSPLWTRHIHHFCRRIGKISTAPSKVATCLGSGFDLRTDVKDLIVTLAEGSGGILSYLMHLFPNCLAIYNTLQDDTVEIKDNILNITPPALVGDACHLIDRLVGLEDTCLGETDITKSVFVNKLDNLIRETGMKIKIWTMDAELKTDIYI